MKDELIESIKSKMDEKEKLQQKIEKKTKVPKI